MEEEPYVLRVGPEGTPSSTQQVDPPLTSNALTALQTMMFAAMWIPSMLAVIFAVVALVLQTENVLLMLLLIPGVGTAFKLGGFGWDVLTARPYWAGFVAGLAGFILLPTYFVLGAVILVKGGDLLAEAELPEPVEMQIAEIGVEREELFFTQGGFGFGPGRSNSSLSRSASEEARWNDCFQELYVGAGDQSLYELQVRRARAKTRGFFGIDPEDIVSETMARVCKAHSKEAKRDLTPYFVKSVSNAIVDVERMRAGTRCRYRVPDTHATEPFTPEEPQPSAEDVLCRLSEDDQEVLRLDLAEYTGPQIAEELGISHTAARKRLQRARSRFKTAWLKASKELEQEK